MTGSPIPSHPDVALLSGLITIVFVCQAMTGSPIPSHPDIALLSGLITIVCQIVFYFIFCHEIL